MKTLIVTMPDGSRWGVPLDIIARNRAAAYADEFGGDIERSLVEDTMPLFEDADSDYYEAIDWARNNMNWSDVKAHAKEMARAKPADYQDGWTEGQMDVLEVTP